MFPLRMADAGIEAASDTAVEEPGVTLLQTTDERDSGGGAEEENDVSCFIEDFVQRKADTKLCFPWRPLSHFSCCPTKALMVLKIDSLFVSAFSLLFSVEILNVRARADWAEKLSLVCARKKSTSCHHGDKW